MAVSKHIDIARDFSPYPAGRYIVDGPYSGESFREKILKTALESYAVVEIELDGAEGYGSSFLEEAFGGLVRKGYFSPDELHEKLKFVSVDDALIAEISSYISSASAPNVN